jgi:hypothetical protein
VRTKVKSRKDIIGTEQVKPSGNRSNEAIAIAKAKRVGVTKREGIRMGGARDTDCKPKNHMSSG